MSSDLEQEPSPPRAPAKRKSKSRARSASASTASCQPGTSLAVDKDAQRRHKALERQYDKARQAMLASVFPTDHPLPSLGRSSPAPGVSDSQALSDPPVRAFASNMATSRGLSRRASLSLPDVSAVGLADPILPQARRPEATFTPTAAGLWGPEGPPLPTQVDFQAMLSNALSSLLAAGLQQSSLQQLQVAPPSASHSTAPL